MRITAIHISQWSKTREAQSELSRLVRRLVHQTATTTAVAIPSGESVARSGWDGIVHSDHGSAWVAKGISFWEMSCEEKVTSKANGDYRTRTKETSADQRAMATFVFVTARPWPGKTKWVEEKRSEQQWLEVRAFDADDLEQWLEQSPGIALAFGEELGLSGPGVETPTRSWQTWALQPVPALSADAIFAGREPVDRFTNELEAAVTNSRALISLAADSVAEAVAFACAVVLDETFAHDAVVITHDDGWRYVEKNPQLRVAIASSPEIAARAVKRDGLAVVAPLARGDLGGGFSRNSDPEFRLERPDRHTFEQALIKLGLEQSDAERLAQTAGRSWSVVRRQRASNSAIRRPTWLTNEHAWVVSTLCLVNSWVSDNSEDQRVVAQIAGRSYEEVERALASLADLDDSPVLKIGRVWKAKAPVEVLDLFGSRITAAELQRYLAVVQEVLSVADPVLELPEEQRSAAAMYGKERPHSGLLFRALADGLAKLAVRGELVSALADMGIEEQVKRAVKNLLHNADATRWLSLDDVFRPLAEAAPEVFIASIEGSLAAADAPVSQLIKETSGASVFGGRCWQADLLWALEILAWSPQYLTRVCLILAKLSHVKTESTWNNSPFNTLLDIFRAWRPQTAATVQQRLRVLDTLIAKDPEVAFRLLDEVVYTHSDSASPSARPRWRDDDAGAGYGTTHSSFSEMYLGAADRLIKLSARNAARLASSIDKLESLDPTRSNLILAAVRDVSSADFTDDDRETVRSALRDRLHHHRNYDQEPEDVIEKNIAHLQELYDALLPADLVVRHEWLFSNGWPNPPERVRGVNGRQARIDKLRLDALKEIHATGGLEAVERLAKRHPRVGHVGWSLAKLGLSEDELASWAVVKSTDLTERDPCAFLVSGVLFGTPPERRSHLLDEMLKHGIAGGWDTNTQAQLLALAPHNQAHWDYVESKGQVVSDFYWRVASPGFIGDKAEELNFVARKLLHVQRPRSALVVCRFDVEEVDPDLLATLLEGVLANREPDGPLPDSWDLRQMVARLETSNAIDRPRLIRLEFGLMPALGTEDEACAKTLYAELRSNPEFLVHLLELVYRRASEKKDETEITEQAKTTAEIAYRVLMHYKQVPGTREDGSVDEAAFSTFVERGRALAADADRVGVFDSTLGEILAYAPAGSDGIWPFQAARDLLDQPDVKRMRDGLSTGLFNKRGMVHKAYAEGGGQERQLAERYREQARALHQSHPLLAAVLEKLAANYGKYGRNEDITAQLRLEGD